MGADKERFTVNIHKDQLDRISKEVQQFHLSEYGIKYPRWAIARALRSWLVRRIDQLTDEVAEVLTTPAREEASEFKELLTASVGHMPALERETGFEGDPATSTLFTGYRPFSMDKLGAMAVYIAEKGKDVYKTKLNKLLFYSDFINFYLHGRSISGARYVHVPFGPVPSEYGTVLEKLQQQGKVDLVPADNAAVIIKAVAEDAPYAALEPDEIETINWVLKEYGSLSASEISELSHSEQAYRFTRPGEEIAYGYAAFLKTLPDQTKKATD